MTWEWAFILVSWTVAAVVIYLDHRRVDKDGLGASLRNLSELVGNRASRIEKESIETREALTANTQRIDSIEKTVAELKKHQSDTSLAMGFPQFRPKGQRG